MPAPMPWCGPGSGPSAAARRCGWWSPPRASRGCSAWTGRSPSTHPWTQPPPQACRDRRPSWRLPGPGAPASRRTATVRRRPVRRAAGVAPGRGGTRRRRRDDHGSQRAAGGHVRLRSRRDGRSSGRSPRSRRSSRGAPSAPGRLPARSRRLTPHRSGPWRTPRPHPPDPCSRVRRPAPAPGPLATTGNAGRRHFRSPGRRGSASGVPAISDALGTRDTQPEPGDEEDGDRLSLRWFEPNTCHTLRRRPR